MCTHTHMCTHIEKQAHMHRCTHTHTQAGIHTCVHTCTCIHEYTHTHAHTYLLVVILVAGALCLVKGADGRGGSAQEICRSWGCQCFQHLGNSPPSPCLERERGKPGHPSQPGVTVSLGGAGGGFENINSLNIQKACRRFALQ